MYFTFKRHEHLIMTNMVLCENCIQYYFTDINLYVASFINMV